MIPLNFGVSAGADQEEVPRSDSVVRGFISTLAG